MAAFIRRSLIAVVLTGVIAVQPAARGQDPNDHLLTEEYISSADGTPLHAWVYRPASLGEGDRTPVIMTVTPYAGSGGTPLAPDPLGSPTPGPWSITADFRLFERGYSLVVVSLRGYGGSGGCYDMGGAGEQADVKAAVEWAASRPWSSGKVGVVGHSYDGMTGLMALGQRPQGLAAVIATSPPAGYHNFYSPGRVRNTGGGTGFGAFYAASDAMPPSIYSPAEQHRNALLGVATNPTCYATVTAGTYEDDPASAFWRSRDLVSPAAGVAVPTMMAHGFNDWNVRPTDTWRIFASLTGPKRLLLGPWDHGIPGYGAEEWAAEEVAFFEEHLRGIPGPPRPAVRVQSVDGTWRAESQWPPADAAAFEMPLLPGSYVDGPGNNGETGLPAQFPVQPPVPLPAGRGSWTFTQPLPYDVHLAGVPVATVSVSALLPGVTAVALLYDVDPSGAATFVSRGASFAPAEGQVRVELYPQDWVFPAGHRIGMLLAGTDDVWLEFGKTLTPVTVTGGSFSLPFLAFRREPLAGGPFEARGPHGSPFAVDAGTIQARTNEATLPPEMEEP